jgi:hypothetical protein
VQTPLIGADLGPTDPVVPHCWNDSIVPEYGRPGVRTEMQDDFAAMRAAGLQTFRIFLYHEHGDPVNTNVMSSSGGHISEPFRTNLINLLTDIRAAGFLQVTLAFNPGVPMTRRKGSQTARPMTRRSSTRIGRSSATCGHS